MKLLSQRMGEIPLTDLPVPLFEKFLIPSSIRRIGAGSSGDYLFQEFPFAGGFIRLTHLLETQENRIIIVEDKPVIIFQMGLQHSLVYRFDDLGEILFHEWGYNCYHTLSLLKEIHFNNKPNYAVLEMQVSPEYFNAIGLQYEFVKKFLDRVHGGESTKLSRFNQVASAAMMEKVRGIFDGDLSDMNDRVKQLLLLAFDNQLTSPVKKISKLSAVQIDKIYEVKDFLFSHLRTIYTQTEISDQMNISEYQIRKGFQEIYGMTAIELSNIERMHRAAILVHKDGKKLWEIAIILGYSSKSSLLKAYKKYYGEPPTNKLPRN